MKLKCKLDQTYLQLGCNLDVPKNKDIEMLQPFYDLNKHVWQFPDIL